MPSQSYTVKEVILAILREAQDAGVKKMTRTSLVKFLYLVDAYAAEESGGRSFTGLSWRFLHFGPYASDVISVIETLVAQSAIEQEDRSSNGKDFVLYSLSSWKQAANLDVLGVPRGAVDRVRRAIREFAFDLAGLLNHVYFHTQPMEHATPGAVLDFTHSKKLQFTDVKQVKMTPLDPKAVKAFRDKLRSAIGERKKSSHSVAWQGEFDETYFEGLSALEDTSLPIGTKGRGKISL